ncbi:hypothetical protein BO83DRAFT_402767 [Aspergillus eucalypticola CBS 122712]|uniref:Uncharacterized protein n=1 Tax=Aspergillus eucalypticola (strain CBS 122712 / IBT 29274) TaxID=1448314 RepID=A0A317UTX4_ASPEC|nr:uncharacterized protein BO83DRAFT_402767 [Aspergillus eucalypticola CBS 122712]PWY63952.1 hypothetical protein BO83DRAFT_402767 [Aspergillus eucalypticola CBS 122712]
MKRDDVTACDADSSAETQRKFDRRTKITGFFLSIVLKERRYSTSLTGDLRDAHRPASNNFTGAKSRAGDPAWRLDTGLITCIAGSISTRTRPRRCACGLGNCSGKGVAAVWMRTYCHFPSFAFFLLGTCQCAHHLHVAAVPVGSPVRGDFVDPSFSYRLIAGRYWPGTHDVSSSREEYPSKAAATASNNSSSRKLKKLSSPIRVKRKRQSSQK